MKEIQKPVDLFEVMDDINNIYLRSRKAKAVCNAFSENFIEHTEDVNLEEIRARPEMYEYLFFVLRDLVFDLYEDATKADNDITVYRDKMRQKGATAPATDDIGKPHPGA